MKVDFDFCDAVSVAESETTFVRESVSDGELISRLCRLAADPETDATILRKLSRQPHSAVKESLLDNPNLPGEVLFDLASDKNPDIRYLVASTPYANGGILRMLQEDENPYVAARASETLERVSREAKLMRRYRDCRVYIRSFSFELAS